MGHAKLQFRIVKMEWWESNIMFLLFLLADIYNLNNMPTDFDIFELSRLHDVWMWDVYQKLLLII